jgi:two-component system, NarL family, invasion response regulator UvrY
MARMIRILIADDHPLVRRGLKDTLVRDMAGLICGEADDTQEVLAKVHGDKWDLVILDITMPGRSGLEILGELKRMQPKLPVLVLSMHPEDQYGKRVLRAGASGYMNKESAPEELLKAVHKVLSGGRYVSATLGEKLAAGLNQGTACALHDALSDREFEILRMIASGRTVSQIADTLHLSVNTVSTYRARVLEKLNMTTTPELIHYALRNQLVD